MEYLQKILDAIQDIKVYQNYKEQLEAEIKKLDSLYQKEKFNYQAYQDQLHALIKGKSKDYWVDYYNSCIYAILDRISYYNNKIFYLFYDDERYEELAVKKVDATEKVDSDAQKVQTKLSILESALGKRLNNKFLETAVKHTNPKEAKTKKESRISFAPILNLKFIRSWISRFKSDSKVISKKTFVHPILRSVRVREEPIDDLKIGITSNNVIVQEAKRIKKLIQKEESLHIYQPSSIGALANITVRKLSLSLIENFPGIFKHLYNSLRLASIQLLSNTYVNIMTFVSILCAVLVTLFSLLYYLGKSVSWQLVIINSLTYGILAAGLLFCGFYFYPGIRIKARRKSINTNLSFAVNHMAAVANSGVPPVAMLKLIAESHEYEEISVEVAKIVDLVEIFGYDITTALRSVAATTPSTNLREFFNGMINNIQSGGDLKSYLKQHADEAMLSYQLERQKYTETISTYSDVYTGVLIAAPLFFVAALSLVGILGGRVANIDVTVIISAATYVVVPLLNLAFLMFLEFSQPEV